MTKQQLQTAKPIIFDTAESAYIDACREVERGRRMKFAYEPSIFLNSAVKYTVCFVCEDKPNIKINSPKELREFIETHAEYDIVGLTPHGFYEMEMDIKRREGEVEE